MHFFLILSHLTKLHSSFNQVYSLHTMGVPKMLQRCLSFRQFCDLRPSPLTHKAGFCIFTSTSTTATGSIQKIQAQTININKYVFPGSYPALQLSSFISQHTHFSTIVGSRCWLNIFCISRDLEFFLYNLLGKTKFSLSNLKNTEKFCSITKDIFFWNSEAGNNDSNYTFYFTMLALCLTIFFQWNDRFDCLKSL